MSLLKYKSKLISEFYLTHFPYLKSYCYFYNINEKDFFKDITDNKIYRHCHYLNKYNMNICKDCKTPLWCKPHNECELKAIEKLEDERQSEEHQNMIETVMNNNNEYEDI